LAKLIRFRVQEWLKPLPDYKAENMRDIVDCQDLFSGIPGDYLGIGKRSYSIER
jgi:hypothetical protein